MPDYYRRLGAPSGITDLVFVTDARCAIDPAIRDRFLAWKQQVRARVLTLVVGDAAGDLAALSDEVHLVASLSTAETGVERALAI
jgi:uncharacterized protein with von Willebrand factor type A (vWA) domain